MNDKSAYAALWFENLSRTSNEAFLPLFFDEHRYLVLKGGGGSGKSIFAGRKVLERVTSEPCHRWLVCRKVAKTIKESCFKQLISQINEYYPECGAQINWSDLSIKFPNQSEILTAGLDDVEKLKSIYSITGIWIEEASELLESDFNQLDIRLRGKTRFYKQIIITFNPVSILHWLKRRFFDTHDPRALVHESTYRDNRFLDEDAKKTLEGFRDTDEYYYSVYCLGEWGVTGKSVFDAAALTRRLLDLLPPVKCGFFEYDDTSHALKNITFRDDAHGFLKIYEDVKEGIPYVIGADTAGDGSDSFVAQVIDNTTGRQVALLRHSFDEDLFAKQVYCLGIYYNTALLAVECNFSTYPILTLERLKYPKLYVRDGVDEYTHRPKKSYGFLTTAKTRPIIISELVQATRSDVSIINDRKTIEEMLTFVRDENFKPTAENGAHDDCVMALAIAHYIRPHQSYIASPSPEKRVKWRDDQWEDYRAASVEEKQLLIEKWGRPDGF